MNYSYGFPIFEKQDILKALWYTLRVQQSELYSRGLAATPTPTDEHLRDIYAQVNSDNIGQYIVACNSDLYLNYLKEKILPDLLAVLNNAGESIGIVNISTTDIYYDLVKAEVLPSVQADKNMLKLIKDMQIGIAKNYGVYYYIFLVFYGFKNKDLEHRINQEFGEYLIRNPVDDSTYLLIAPDDNYAKVFDIVEAIFETC